MNFDKLAELGVTCCGGAIDYKGQTIARVTDGELIFVEGMEPLLRELVAKSEVTDVEVKPARRGRPPKNAEADE